MELLIRDGDYVPDGAGGFERLEGAQEVLERVLFRLTARRGGMPFLPELGSRLHTLGRERPSERRELAAQYVSQALAQERDLQVEQVELADGTDGGMMLRVYLKWQGERLQVETRIGAGGRG